MSKINDFIFPPLVPKEEIKDIFGEEMGQIIIDERRIIFYHYGLPVGALIGSIIIIVYLYVKIYGVIYNVW